jgi:ribosomal protein S7
MWAKKACDLSQNDPPSMDTYACLLYKNGKKKEAIKIEEEAIEKLKKKNTSDEELKGYIENIENWKMN